MPEFFHATGALGSIVLILMLSARLKRALRRQIRRDCHE